jgi:hypothetical protein
LPLCSWTLTQSFTKFTAQRQCFDVSGDLISNFKSNFYNNHE